MDRNVSSDNFEEKNKGSFTKKLLKGLKRSSMYLEKRRRPINKTPIKVISKNIACEFLRFLIEKIFVL